MRDSQPNISRLASRRQMLRMLPALTVLAAVPPSALASNPTHRASRQLLGTRVDLIAHGRSAAMLQEAADSAFDEMARLSAMMSRYEPDSPISQLNQRAGTGTRVSMPPEALAVLQAGQSLHRATGGLFDMSIGSMKSWRFEPGAERRIPSFEQLLIEQRGVNGAALVVNAPQRWAELPHTGMALDLGGVAKLPILEAGMKRLQAWGIRDALINGGGDVLYLGSNQGAAWRVGLRDARRPDRLLGVLPLQGQGVLAASGDYERFFLASGQKQHHILDPRTGHPARAASGASFWARDVETLNGLGTAFMIAGREYARDWSGRHPDLQALLFESDGKLWATSSFRTAFQGLI